MKRPILKRKRVLWLGLAVLPFAAIATIAVGRISTAPPPPEISLGVLRSCTQMGVVAKGIAEDRAAGIAVDAERYRHYRQELVRRQPLFESPGLALIIAYAAKELEPTTVQRLGVQTCVASYYGFHEARHIKALQAEALSCQEDSKDETDEGALEDCMGDSFQHTLAVWWEDMHRES